MSVGCALFTWVKVSSNWKMVDNQSGIYDPQSLSFNESTELSAYMGYVSIYVQFIQFPTHSTIMVLSTL